MNLFAAANKLLIKGFYLGYKKTPKTSISCFSDGNGIFFFLLIRCLHIHFAPLFSQIKASLTTVPSELSTISALSNQQSDHIQPEFWMAILMINHRILYSNSEYANKSSQVSRILQNNRENMTNHPKSSALQTAVERKNTPNIFIKIYLGEKLYRHIFILSFRTCK